MEIRVPEKYKQDEAFNRMNLDGEKKYLASISFDREYHEYITPAYFLPTSVDVEESYLCVWFSNVGKHLLIQKERLFCTTLFIDIEGLVSDFGSWV